jgi:UDP-glucuronate 4-epimerase
MKILVTGAAGFIGMHTCKALLDQGHEVLGIDNLNDYYDPQLKHDRLSQLAVHPGFEHQVVDVADAPALLSLFQRGAFDGVIHLAAQAGVRYSLSHPQAYIQSNLVGFANVLEACRAHPPQHLVYASSSSVYGHNTKLPYAETDPVDRPVSLYAATKKSNELMAYSYSHLYGLAATGLRFFTVYGPWGRPDMSPMLFLRAILAGEPIQVFNHGQMQRDFTYVDDIVRGVVEVLQRPPQIGPDLAVAHRILNIGNHQPVGLLDYVALMEKLAGRPAQIDLRPMQAGDVLATYADTTAIRALTGFQPNTPLEVGLGHFVRWYRGYYQV